MPNPAIFEAVPAAWSNEPTTGRKILDLSCGGGHTAQMLAKLGFQVVATDFGEPPRMHGVQRIGGGDLNSFLPFHSESFDAVELVEVIEHIENQPQLIREIARILRPEGVVLISTPNILNVFSRIRFVFTGFLRGRVRPVHYASKPGQAPNIYLIHFYELYYLFFHYGFQVIELQKTRVKVAALFFTWLLWPLMWLFSLVAVIHAEKDPIQRRYNWEILAYFFNPALLLSDNIVVKAKKNGGREDRSRP